MRATEISMMWDECGQADSGGEERLADVEHMAMVQELVEDGSRKLLDAA